MFSLPSTTESQKRITKKELFASPKFVDLTSAQKRAFDKNISSLTIVNSLTPTTIPSIQEGSTIKSIFVLKVELNLKEYDKKQIILLAEKIPQTQIFALVWEDELQLAVYFRGLFITRDWEDLDDCTNITLIGNNFDVVWKNIICSITNLEASSLDELEPKLKKKENIENLKTQIDELDIKCRKEKQPYYKNILFNQMLTLQDLLNKESKDE